MKASDFVAKRNAHEFRLKSSMKHNMYLLPLLDLGEIGPQMSA
jgi:hypothetical protein